MNKYIILCRESLMEQDEINALKNSGINYTFNRTKIEATQNVLCRYSCLPYYRELQSDLEALDAKLLTSYSGHLFCADLQEWYYQLGEEYTPKTWNTLYEIDDLEFPIIIKGKTNSRKSQWKKMMFAETRKDAIQVMNRLLDDTFISQQGLVYRKFIKFKSYGESVNGLKITNEWRVFFYKDEVLCKGFYWSENSDLVQNPEPPDSSFMEEVIVKLRQSNICPDFLCVDFGQKEDESWNVVEINDFQMSGLSCVDPNEFYKKLKEKLEN